MKIGVAGLWHLGCVTAACLAQAGFDVCGTDEATIVSGLAAGHAPLFEPGLDELLAAGIAAGRLRFSADPAAALRDADVLWITYDTPVDDHDHADVDAVVARARALLPLLREDAAVVLSSQLPVGATRALRDWFAHAHPGRTLQFACSPENLRLGAAIAAFRDADRIVVGCASAAARQCLEPLFARLDRPVLWMGLESAEMVKHSINAFLAASITFTNEIATICERVGADASEVEAGLRSEPRIGRRAYVTPGGAFGGGTLARDVGFLSRLASAQGLAIPVIDAILPGNQQHGLWAFRRICELCGAAGQARLTGVRAAILGLTYKPNTSTLRRSTALELCLRLHASGAEVVAFDPVVNHLPAEFAAAVRLAPSAEAACADADVLVIATEWPEFTRLDPAALAAAMRRPLVIDQNGLLAGTMGRSGALSYYRVGQAG